MARSITPASISYIPEGGPYREQFINFHAVLSEDHEAKATITKYPVQEGLHVSNHSIRHNRTVVLEGLITNVQLEGPRNVDYGITPTKTVKDAFDALVLSGAECTVTTNLGIYTPVVFSNFKTKQKAGMMDSMQFTIIGEEIIKVDTNTYTAPTPVIFSVVTGPDRAALVDELATSEIYVGPTDTISKGSYIRGHDFTINGMDKANQPVRTTYIYKGLDPTTAEDIYEVDYDDNAAGIVDTSDIVSNDCCVEEVPTKQDQLLAGVSQVSDCLLETAITGEDSILNVFVEDTIDTAMGRLQKSIRGVFYDVTTMGDEYGTMLAAAGVGCVVRGVTGEGSDTPFTPGEALPTTEQIMDGAKEGLGITEPKPVEVTLIMIECACTESDFAPEYDDFLNVANIA